MGTDIASRPPMRRPLPPRGGHPLLPLSAAPSSPPILHGGYFLPVRGGGSVAVAAHTSPLVSAGSGGSRGSIRPESPVPSLDFLPRVQADGFVPFLLSSTKDNPIRVNLDRYSRIRAVLGDGECFYRSFITSYLEQVLDRQDTYEEHRFVRTIERVSTEHTNLGWSYEFRNSDKAFKKLIKKVMKWKRKGRQNNIASTNSYRKEKLLESFSAYDTETDSFVFPGSVVAIHICSHSRQYEETIPGIGETYSLKDWCFQCVTSSREFTDLVMMKTFAIALEVPLRLDRLYGRGYAEVNIYTGPGVVNVTLLYTGNHFDIIYPRAPSAESSSQLASWKEHPAG